LGQEEFDRLLAEGAKLDDGEVLGTALSRADGE
jgi:hypothetical protein